MRYVSRIVLVVLSLIALALAPAPRAQQPAAAGVTMSVDELVDRITKAEAALTARMRAYHPLVEVYIQNLAPDPKLGTVPTHDDYFLGQFDGKDGPNLTPLSPQKGLVSADRSARGRSACSTCPPDLPRRPCRTGG